MMTVIIFTATNIVINLFYILSHLYFINFISILILFFILFITTIFIGFSAPSSTESSFLS